MLPPPYLTLETVFRGYEFSFPVIYADDSLVEAKINTCLQWAELAHLPGGSKNNMFEKVMTDDGTRNGGKVCMAYRVMENTKNVLALEFQEQSAGDTTASWIQYYNFNPQNGDCYDLHDFFNAHNFEIFRKMFVRRRKQKLIEQADRSYLGDQCDIFQEHVLAAIEYDSLDDFYFTRDSIFVNTFNHLSEYDKSHNINHVTGIAIREIGYLLNEFGESALVSAKKLSSFSNAPPAVFPMRPLPCLSNSLSLIAQKIIGNRNPRIICVHGIIILNISFS